MRKNTYEIVKNVEKIRHDIPTGFLPKNICRDVKEKMRKKEYQEFIPYPDSEKIILYHETLPKVKLFKIECWETLRHSSVLGSLFALNISLEMFGDIVLYHNFFYVYLLESISELVKNELSMIDKYSVKLVEVDLDTLQYYQREYEPIKLIVSSLRIDTVISRLIGCNRKHIHELVKDNDILLNESVLKKVECLLKENDTFSIRKYGKYRFKEIIGETKKENYIILIEKYI